MRILLASAYFLCLFAHAEMTVEAVSKDGKKANIRLDNAKNYQVGDDVLFYKNRKLISRGTITLVTPKKTKAAVTLTHGAPFQGDYVAYHRYLSQIEGKRSQVARKEIRQDNVERKPASISNIKTSIPSAFANTTTRDLLYYPDAQTFLLNVEGHYAQEDLKLDGLSNIKQTGAGIAPTLFYSPIENFAVGLGLGYENRTVESGGTSDSGGGITDPSIHATYQLLAEKEDGFQWVLVAEISPSIGDSKENNALRGNHLIRVGSFFGFRHKLLSWSFLPNLTYYTETKTEGGTDDMDSYYEFAVEAQAQYDLSQRWAIYAPLLISYTGEQAAKDASYKIKSYMTLGLGVGFKYAVSEPLNLYFDGRYKISPSVKAETALPSSHDGDLSGFIINMGANYRF